MRIAVLSDIHDHVWNLQAVLGALPAVDALICCGDLCSPFVVDLLAQRFAGVYRVLVGMALAVIVGLPLGILMGRFKPV